MSFRKYRGQSDPIGAVGCVVRVAPIVRDGRNLSSMQVLRPILKKETDIVVRPGTEPCIGRGNLEPEKLREGG